MIYLQFTSALLVLIILFGIFKFLCLIYAILGTVTDAHVRQEEFNVAQTTKTLDLLHGFEKEIFSLVESRDKIRDDLAALNELHQQAATYQAHLREKFDVLALDHRNLLENLARALQGHVSFDPTDTDDMIRGVKYIIEERDGLRELRKTNADKIQEFEKCRERDKEMMETAGTAVNRCESRIAGIEAVSFNLASEEIMDFAGIDASERANGIIRPMPAEIHDGNTIDQNIKAWAKRVARRVRTIADRRVGKELIEDGSGSGVHA